MQWVIKQAQSVTREKLLTPSKESCSPPLHVYANLTRQEIIKSRKRAMKNEWEFPTLLITKRLHSQCLSRTRTTAWMLIKFYNWVMVDDPSACEVHSKPSLCSPPLSRWRVLLTTNTIAHSYQPRFIHIARLQSRNMSFSLFRCLHSPFMGL